MKKMLTTGEVADILGVSRLTVQRKFDRGELWGEQNAITGKRLISRECVKKFMKGYGLGVGQSAEPASRLLLCSPDESIQKLLEDTVGRDERVKIDIEEFGADALVLCSATKPDLLLIDEAVADIPAKTILDSLKRTGLDESTHTLLFTDTGASGEYLKWGADGYLSKDDINQASLVQSVYPLLELVEPDDLSTDPTEHKRRWPRFPVKLPAKIEVYSLDDPAQRTRGEGVIRNISREGAFIAELIFKSRSIPAHSFGMRLRIADGPLADWEADCRVIRLHALGDLSAGVEFIDLPEASAERLESLLR